MKFKEIEFSDKNSKRIYHDYLNRVKNTTKVLSKENQHEILLEINSHIYESLIDNTESEEDKVEKLLDILEKLGQPENFLQPLVAEKKLEEATKSFNPIKIIKALALNIGNGISYIIFSFLYLFLFSFVFLIIAKLVKPENVGFYYDPNNVFLFGYFTNSKAIKYSQYEQLGNWFIPINILLIVILYIFLTLLLKLKKKHKQVLS